MKTPPLITSILALITTAAFAQGPLAPSGAPAPSMKTLQQVEPRGDVNRLSGDATALYVISSPGSYFLSGDILAADAKNGIRIATNDVSLDLRGFRVSGESIGGQGIVFDNAQSQAGPVRRCIVRNGIVTGWTSHGVSAENSRQCIFRDLITSANGGSGLIVTGASVSGCVAGDNSASGIRATDSALSDCVVGTESVTDPAVDADRSQLSGFTVSNDFNSIGIRLLQSSLQNSTVSNCETGVSAVQSQVRHCNVSRYSVGVDAHRSLISGNTVTTGLGGPGSAGIRAVSDCQIFENMIEDNRFGIDITGSYCRVERNHVSIKDFLAPDGVAIRAANGTPGRNIITLNNITGFDPLIHVAEIAVDGGDHAPIAGPLGAADGNYLQPVP